MTNVSIAASKDACLTVKGVLVRHVRRNTLYRTAVVWIKVVTWTGVLNLQRGAFVNNVRKTIPSMATSVALQRTNARDTTTIARVRDASKAILCTTTRALNAIRTDALCLIQNAFVCLVRTDTV